MFEQGLQEPVVPFRELPDGLYWVKRKSQYPLIEHHGILVVGEPLQAFGIHNLEPIVVHQSYPGMRVEWASSTGSWYPIGQIPADHIPSALSRVSAAFAQPGYDLLSNNCEHVARYIAIGEKRSTQVIGIAAVVLLLATIWAVNRSGR